MKKKEFQNLPSTETPITAENLNEMQDNIEEAIPTKLSELSNDKGYLNVVYKNYTCASMDEFKNYLLTNSVPQGVTIFYLNNTSTSVYCAIVLKLSNLYLSYILFGYSRDAVQYKYVNGSWSQTNLV